MIIHDNRFSKDENVLLRSCVGKRLEQIEGIEVADHVVWDTVRLRFCNGEPVDITNTPQSLIVSPEGIKEEYGVLSVQTSGRNPLHIEGMDTASIYPVNSIVRAIDVVENSVEIIYDHKSLSKRIYAQAIVLTLENNLFLGIDKQTWFGEMLSIKKDRSKKDVVRDESIDWEDDQEEDPDRHIVFTTSQKRLFG